MTTTAMEQLQPDSIYRPLNNYCGKTPYGRIAEGLTSSTLPINKIIHNSGYCPLSNRNRCKIDFDDFVRKNKDINDRLHILETQLVILESNINIQTLFILNLSLGFSNSI